MRKLFEEKSTGVDNESPKSPPPIFLQNKLVVIIFDKILIVKRTPKLLSKSLLAHVERFHKDQLLVNKEDEVGVQTQLVLCKAFKLGQT